MNEHGQKKPIDDWQGVSVSPGESRDVELSVTESYSSLTVNIPIHVCRGVEDGPVVLVTAALHGDEINGTGAVRQMIQDDDFRLLKGSVILVPVVNLLAFDRHSRYLPDRRDLNRCFPGSPTGSLASRMAHTIFQEIVLRSDFGIDLHTAAVRRTNYPNVRGDLADAGVSQIAKAFGSEIIINTKGPRKSFRRAACNADRPAIVVEGGEVWKVEPAIVETMVRGVKNVLHHFKMLSGDPTRPAYQVEVERTKWIRAERGGFLRFHVSPGEIVEKGQALATNTTLLGREHRVLEAPFGGVVIGMTTLPAIAPGEPVCNLGRLPKGVRLGELRERRSKKDNLEERVMDDLSASLLVTDRPRED